jgi:ankyrin repeat protein
MCQLAKIADLANSLAEPCTHVDCDSRFVNAPTDGSDVWTCYGCRKPVQISSERIQLENAAIAAVREEDLREGAGAASLHARGVTVEYLNRFTDAHDCWEWPTWRVVRDIIKPDTANTRQRFADLLQATEGNVVGLPNVFVSHSWAAKWGVLVAAASRGSEDGKRRVWLDVFAVRQWDGNEADLDFSGVVQRCRALIVAFSHEIFQESKFAEDKRYLASLKRNFQEMFAPGVRAKLPFARSWCLAEVVAAAISDRMVIVSAGLAHRDGDFVGEEIEHLKVTSESRTVESSELPKWRPSRQMAVSYFGLLEALGEFAKLEYAEAGQRRDQERIFRLVTESIGFRRFNAEARAAILGGSCDETEAPGLYSMVCDGRMDVLRNDARQRSDRRARARLLQTVAGAGVVEGVDLLVRELGYDINDDSVPAIWAASGMGRLKVVRYLGARGAAINVYAGNRSTPLANAALHGHLQVVRFLLDSGADPNLRGFRGTTPLINAAKNGHVEVLLALHQKNADTGMSDDYGQQALYWAAMGGHTEAAEALVQRCGANVNARNGENEFTALHVAAAYGEERVVETLAGNLGADVNARAIDASTPVVSASINGHAGVVALLLRLGADLCAANQSGWTACITAADDGNVEILRVFAEAAATAYVKRSVIETMVRMRTAGGMSALEAAIFRNHVGAVQVLVEQLGADVNEWSRQGLTPLEIAFQSPAAIKQKDVSAASILLAHGADATKLNRTGMSVLFSCRNRASIDILAADESRRRSLQLLVELRTRDGNSALAVAAASGDEEAVIALADVLRADMNSTNFAGETPLHLAARYGHQDALRACLNRGANPSARNSLGMRAIDIAQEMGNNTIVSALTEREAL